MNTIFHRPQTNGTVTLNTVGNVTITDRVAGNFSGDNYLITSQILDLSQPNYEIVCKFKITSLGDVTLILHNHLEGGITLSCREDGSFKFWLKNSNDYYIANGVATGLVFVVGKIYTLKFKRTSGSNYSIYIAEGDGPFVEIYSLNTTSDLISSTYGLDFGGGGTNVEDLNPHIEIYLDGTYITIDGQLWCGSLLRDVIPTNINYENSGTTSEANYLIVNDKLVWVNPKIYLQSSGTQYINTGIQYTNNMEFKANICPTGAMTDHYFSGHYYSGKRLFTIGGFYQNQLIIGCGNAQILPKYASNNIWYSYDVFYTNSSSASYLNALIDGQTFTVSSQTIGNNVIGSDILIFARLTGGSVSSYLSCKSRSVQIYDNGTLVRNFVPVYAGLKIGTYTVPSNGMFDIVTQTFYGNSGSGTFTYGKDS